MLRDASWVASRIQCHSRNTKPWKLRETVTAMWNTAILGFGWQQNASAWARDTYRYIPKSLCKTAWNDQILACFECIEREPWQWIFYLQFSFTRTCLLARARVITYLHCFVPDWLLVTQENSRANQRRNTKELRHLNENVSCWAHERKPVITPSIRNNVKFAYFVLFFCSVRGLWSQFESDSSQVSHSRVSLSSP